MKLSRFMLVAAVASLSNTTARAQHNTDIWVGQSGGRLALHPGGLQSSARYLPLDPVDTFLHGWSNNHPGFDHAVTSSGGVAPLQSGADIWLEVVELAPALFVIDNAFNILEFPGDMARLGGSTLHTHLTWFVDLDDPAFDDARCVFPGTFRLVDLGTRHYVDSDPFTLLFTKVSVRGGGFPPSPVEADGDFDLDGDVDPDDFAALAVCLGGPFVRPMPQDPLTTTCEVECHNAFDFDNDLDVDLRDVDRLMREAHR